MFEPRQKRPGDNAQMRSVQLRPIAQEPLPPRAASTHPVDHPPRQIEAPPEVVLWGRCGLVPAARATEEPDT